MVTKFTELEKMWGNLIFLNNFEYLLTGIRIGHNPYIMRQTACLVLNPIMVDDYVPFFNYMGVVWASASMTASL